MAMTYAYDYAQIDPATNMCIGVHSTSYISDDPYWIEIPVNDPEYLLKFYINGEWYEDPEGTIPWTSSMV